jgi:hypothetical protein
VLRRRDGRLFTVAPGILAELAQAGLSPPLPEPAAEAEPAADPVEAAERAAVQAEPEPPPKGTPEYARWYSEHTLRALENARTVRGLLAAALQRPPYWPDTGSPPPQGAWCTTCRGSRWWRPTHPATDGTRTGPGWRCATCHPPDHVPKNQIVEAKT